MSEPKNSVATVKQDADKNILWKKFEEYVENNNNEIFIDYRDELSTEQVNSILEGNQDDVRYEIEEHCSMDMDRDDYYWHEMAEELEVQRWQIEEWLSGDGFYPATVLSDHDWNRLLRNTSVKVTAAVWDADWNFNNWAYGGPVTYSDVKESLRILGINPKEFLDKMRGGSMAGEGKLKGWFPDMPQRVPKVNIDDLWNNMCVLYDGVMNFCLGDLENVIEVTSSDSKEITFKAGTNVVMYDFGNGAGITEVELTGDVTIKRSEVTFRNDDDSRYGIESCYGFGQGYWNEGGVKNGKK